MSTAKSMVTLAQEYLDYRRGLGFELKIEGQQLLRFAEYADQSGHQGAITTELALRWSRLPEDASRLYQAKRLEVVRCFAKYRSIFDPNTEIPPNGIFGKAHQRTAPHIYSDKELRDLLEAAAQLSPAGGLRARTYSTLFGLLASTGLRISEALRLRREEVDLEQGILKIVETKFHKSRLVVVHPSTRERLRAYARVRDQHHPIAESEMFLLSQRGRALKYSTVRDTFRSICDRLKWESNGGRRRPRMYDLRHTFACRRLLQWYRDGVDVDHAMASLSTHLGHSKVTDTYWYITGIPELMKIAAERFESFTKTNGKETH